MTTSFFFSILTNRAFLVLWEHPIPFDTLFDSPNINWASPFTPTSTIVKSSTGYSFWTDKALIEERDAKVTYDLANDFRETIDAVFNGSSVDEGLLRTWKDDGLAEEGQEPGRWLRVSALSSPFCAGKGLIPSCFLFPSVHPESWIDLSIFRLPVGATAHRRNQFQVRHSLQLRRTLPHATQACRPSLCPSIHLSLLPSFPLRHRNSSSDR